MSDQPLLSVVVPVLNEQDNVEPLALGVSEALGPGDDWELLFVNDGSTDETSSRVAELCRADHRIRLITLARRYGQSTAMQAGFDHSVGEVVVTLDGDLQNDPADIPLVVDKLGEGYDLVAGYRMRRKDRLLTRKVPSWIANGIIRWITGVPIRDNGCSLKAYRRSLLNNMRLYSDLHRFIPALAAATSNARIAEVEVRHHHRRFGTSKYGLSRVAKVMADLLTIKMIRSFRLEPLRMFSQVAGMTLLLGMGIGALAVLARTLGTAWSRESLVLPASSLLLVALAAFFFMLGLLAEVVIRSRAEERAHRPLTLTAVELVS